MTKSALIVDAICGKMKKIAHLTGSLSWQAGFAAVKHYVVSDNKNEGLQGGRGIHPFGSIESTV